MAFDPQDDERIVRLLAERLAMGSMLVTGDRVALDDVEALGLARWLVRDLAAAGVALDVA